jgi:hypothetical protein
VRVKAKVPIGVAIEGIKLAKGGVLPFIGPSETPVLEVDFLELTRLKRGSEAVDTAPINVALIFISSSSNLVEVP